MIICSSPKKEGEPPSEWYDTKEEAQAMFDYKITELSRTRRRKVKAHWILEIKHEGKYNIFGAV